MDIKFCDFLGTWQHFCVPIAELTAKSYAAEMAARNMKIKHVVKVTVEEVQTN